MQIETPSRVVRQEGIGVYKNNKKWKFILWTFWERLSKVLLRKKKSRFERRFQDRWTKVGRQFRIPMYELISYLNKNTYCKGWILKTFIF